MSFSIMRITFSLLFLATATLARANETSLPLIDTTSGLIRGHSAPNRTCVAEFLGIKYAAAPIGELRFAPPNRFTAPSGAFYEASKWPSGLRVWKNFAAQNNNPSSEDCLALNIWTKGPGISAKKPVLVYFHGGRFTIPGPHSPFFSGQYLADTENVVVITVNYRLGIFGFSGAPGATQNVALLDQRSAVEWVRDNIEGFGGDPSRITIFGQSAGGSSVDYWSFAWREDPIVAGLIPQSGTSLSFLPNTKEYSESLWYNVSQASEASSVLACVRAADVVTILAAAAKVPALPTLALPQATFHPTIDNATVFADYEARAAAGRFARVPMLAGNNDFEAGWYKLSAWAARTNLTEAQWDLYDERAFTCPSSYTTKYRVQHGVPTWRYRYFGDWDNLRLYNGTAGLGPRGSGAYHGSELEMVFGTAQGVSGVKNSPTEDAMSKYMMGAWVAFARDPQRGLLADYAWPRYDPAVYLDASHNKTLI
ncbi:cholinesterase precursor [Apiospora kogelbergensis]|uniref:Carboxylic ester hydrolase n=1 Tax=Apiospora kogelbergensis TaxID=1337665 RepID=A0AAW0Q9Q9_9PEZI